MAGEPQIAADLMQRRKSAALGHKRKKEAWNVSADRPTPPDQPHLSQPRKKSHYDFGLLLLPLFAGTIDYLV